MRESLPHKVISSNSVHLKIQQCLDQFQRAFQLKSQPMPDYIAGDIHLLRTLVNQTENADVLIACLKQHLLSMRTYKEFWNIIWRTDCFLCTYTYMSTAIKGMEKDTEIALLRRDKLQLEADMDQQKKLHQMAVQALQRQSDERADEINATMQVRITDLEDAIQAVRNEVTSLSGAKAVLEARLIEGQARISQVDSENVQLLDQLGSMQALMDAELVQHEDAHVIDVQMDGQNIVEQPIATSVTS